jgi:MraZ protein
VASFRGSFTHQIDGKSRLALPKPFRRITGVKRDGQEPFLVLAKGFNGCLAAYTEAEWEKFESRLRTEPFTDQEDRDFVLELASTTADVPIDTVGRILIPAPQLEIGGLEKNSEVRIVGLFDHFEIWSSAGLEKRKSQAKGTFEERAKGFFGQRP